MASGKFQYKKEILKFVEILFIFIALVCITVAKQGMERDYNEQPGSGYVFFRIIHILGILMAIFMFLLNCRREILGSARLWGYVNVGFSCVMAVLCPIAGAVMIRKTRQEFESNLYKTHQGKWAWYTNNSIAAIIFSFFLAFVFLVDGLVQKQANEEETNTSRQRSQSFQKRLNNEQFILNSAFQDRKALWVLIN